MLQYILTGTAQEAYSSLSFADSQKYSVIKSAVLKAFKLVHEAYRQHSQTWRKGNKQTHLEFACDLTTHFMHWCSVSKVESFEKLCDLIVLEQFKNSIPENIAMYISEQNVKTAAEVAALADDCFNAHM